MPSVAKVTDGLLSTEVANAAGGDKILGSVVKGEANDAARVAFVGELERELLLLILAES